MPDTGTPDSGTPDAGVTDPHVRFVVPTTTVHAASQTVHVQVVVDILVDRVDLVVDGVVVTNLATPYAWDLVTSALSPGDHVVTPRALVGGTSFDGPSFTLTIDRVQPTLQTVALSTMKLLPGSFTPIVATFDESLDAATSQVTITVDQYTPGQGTPTPGTLSVSGATVTFTPSIPWIEGMSVSVVVGGTARDLAGNQKACASSIYPTVQSYWAFGQPAGSSVDFTAAVPGTGDFLFAGLHPAYSGATVGSVEVYGSVDGVALVAPALDPGFTSAQLVRGGLDASGVVHVLVQAYNGATFDRELVVETRDPVTEAWTGQVLIGAADTTFYYSPMLFVAPNGHAFVQYTESTNVGGNVVDVTRTYHRAPGDTSFTLDPSFDTVYFAGTYAFPGTSGRYCFVGSTFDGGTGVISYTMDCEGGGAPALSIPLISAMVGSGPNVSLMSVNAHGDATFVVDQDVYVFEGATETLTKTTMPDLVTTTTLAIGIGTGGHVCFAYRGWTQSGAALLVMQKAPAASFGAEETVVMDPLTYYHPTRVAVDEAGHCFIQTSGGMVLHDATYDGAWSVPFGVPPTSAPGLFAGVANQAFLAGNNSPDGVAYIRYFTPLTP